ncbi:hypothetical protein AtNW77_Chr1g0073091 [Arabidopsis thaliana]|jgi:hypothetical protein|uniref:F14O23.12 n=4 Tax=Arabidopsis TaxID=3701 RepID=Q9M9H2_ARATH|nr:nucleolar protein [Arabidopsis thaliana]KAG7651370.1 hypothetical protein ISN45_At01g062450 [Arabidopsis thaliana x Arabidopsis arenosa]KAG7659232.1 hypothetical protein ISN44_As01g061360 [Arabidopsis suecica]AAF43227.1 F14O23.12 [Arabidopsis thaliana]AAX55098.1 hypothetical protein At1g71740 [Arabidopsis thaliana]AEE35225.1 nucleolar protein [Arabidopsis thaliana]|eukprot:NP_177319.1 nucleolar protein [Arabidopsis thaliana]
MAQTVPPSRTKPLTIFKMGLASASVRLVNLASHSKRKLRRWAACYGSRDYEPVIYLQNDMTMMNNGGVYEYNGDPSMLLSGDQRRGPLWQKNILMGGKCQLPDFSGVILYDADGQVVPPAKNSLPLLTWK